MHREKAMRELQTGKTAEALVSAEMSHSQIAAVLKESEQSPLLVAELAKSALILGTAQMADGKVSLAKNTWIVTAEHLDNQTIRIFDFSPIRRQLAINLGDTEKAAEVESVLLKAGYKDPRFTPDLGGTGFLASSVSPINPSKEN